MKMLTLVRKKSAMRMQMEIATTVQMRRLPDAGPAAGDQAEVAAEDGDDRPSEGRAPDYAAKYRRS
jgi:hypothetical protein